MGSPSLEAQACSRGGPLTCAAGPCLQEAQQLLTAFSVRNPLCLQHLNAHFPETMFQPEAGRPDRAAAQAALVRPGRLSAFCCLERVPALPWRLLHCIHLLWHGNCAVFLSRMCSFWCSICFKHLQIEPLLIAALPDWRLFCRSMGLLKCLSWCHLSLNQHMHTPCRRPAS